MPDRCKGNDKRGCTDPCPICGRTVSRASDMKRHMKTHDDSAKIPCPFENCTFRTLQRSNLNTHIRRHTNERIFICKDNYRCKFDTVDSASLLRHRKRRHKYIPGGRRRTVFSVRQEALKKKKQTEQKKQNKKRTNNRKERKEKLYHPTSASHPRRERASRVSAVDGSNGIDIDKQSGPTEPPALSHSSPMLSIVYNAPEPQLTTNGSHIERPNSPPTFVRVYDPAEEVPVPSSRPLESLCYTQERYENPYSPTFIGRRYPQTNPSRFPSPFHCSLPSSLRHEYHRLPPLHHSRGPLPAGRYKPYYSHYSSRPSAYSDRAFRGSGYPPNASYLFGDTPPGHHYIPPVLAAHCVHSPALSAQTCHHDPHRSPSYTRCFYDSPHYSWPPPGDLPPSPYSEGQSIFILRPASYPDNTSDSGSTDENSLDSGSLSPKDSFSIYSPISAVRSSIGSNDNVVRGVFENLFSACGRECSSCSE